MQRRRFSPLARYVNSWLLHHVNFFYRAELVKRDQKATEGTPVRRYVQIVQISFFLLFISFSKQCSRSGLHYKIIERDVFRKIEEEAKQLSNFFFGWAAFLFVYSRIKLMKHYG